MYIPDHFAVSDQATLIQLARENNFGILVSLVDEQPFASHLPFDIRETGDDLWLYGHVAKANPHWRHFAGNNALVIFEGPHGYISPTWYQEPGVPTWNYCVVHMRGEVEAMPSREPTREVVESLSENHEADNPEPWIPDYPDAMLDAIVGFRMRVIDIKGKFKLSQNRNDADKNRVFNHLEKPFDNPPAEHHKALSLMMKKHYKTT